MPALQGALGKSEVSGNLVLMSFRQVYFSPGLVPDEVVGLPTVMRKPYIHQLLVVDRRESDFTGLNDVIF